MRFGAPNSAGNHYTVFRKSVINLIRSLILEFDRVFNFGHSKTIKICTWNLNFHKTEINAVKWLDEKEIKEMWILFSG